MPVITGLERQKRRQRIDVHLDGQYGFTVGLDLAIERHLAVGLAIDDAGRRQLESEDQRRRAVASALSLLAVQPRTARDLSDRLRRRGFPQPAVDAAIERMRALGYLDDAAYARFYVEARLSATPRSRRALAFELSRKGVEREVAAESVAELSDEDAAYEAAQRRLRALRGLDRQAFTRRLGAFLSSRGFGYGVARSTIDRCWRELDEQAESEDEDQALML
jgi:regulatory protein